MLKIKLFLLKFPQQKVVYKPVTLAKILWLAAASVCSTLIWPIRSFTDQLILHPINNFLDFFFRFFCSIIQYYEFESSSVLSESDCALSKRKHTPTLIMEWKCPKCEGKNFGYNCRKCRTPKPVPHGNALSLSAREKFLRLDNIQSTISDTKVFHQPSEYWCWSMLLLNCQII